MDANLAYGEKAWRILHKSAARCIELILESISIKYSSCLTTFHPSRKPSKLDEQDLRDTAGEVRITDVPLLITSHGRARDGWPARTIASNRMLHGSPAGSDRRWEWAAGKGQEKLCKSYDLMIMIWNKAGSDYPSRDTALNITDFNSITTSQG